MLDVIELERGARSGLHGSTEKLTEAAGLDVSAADRALESACYVFFPLTVRIKLEGKRMC